jgi:dTDP-4-dehydrorhamnose reductase
MTDILAIGGSGYVGTRLLRKLGPRRVLSTYAHRPFPGGVHFDCRHMRLADTLLTGKPPFKAAVLLQGISDLEFCARHPAAAHETNVAAAIRMVDDLVDAGIKPIFISSDGVFDGSTGPRAETDEARPILTYGRQKLEVERYVASRCREWTVLRLTKVISACLDRRNLLYELLQKVAQGEIIRAAYDQTLSPVVLDDVVDAIDYACTGRLNGLYHVAGSQILSRVELVKMLLSSADAGFREKARIEVCSLDDFQLLEARPKNCSLSNKMLVAATGHQFRSLEAVCGELCDAFFGRATAAGWHSAPRAEIGLAANDIA